MPPRTCERKARGKSVGFVGGAAAAWSMPNYPGRWGRAALSASSIRVVVVAFVVVVVVVVFWREGPRRFWLWLLLVLDFGRCCCWLVMRGGGGGGQLGLYQPLPVVCGFGQVLFCV